MLPNSGLYAGWFCRYSVSFYFLQVGPSSALYSQRYNYGTIEQAFECEFEINTSKQSGIDPSYWLTDLYNIWSVSLTTSCRPFRVRAGEYFWFVMSTLLIHIADTTENGIWIRITISHELTLKRAGKWIFICSDITLSCPRTSKKVIWAIQEAFVMPLSIQ